MSVKWTERVKMPNETEKDDGAMWLNASQKTGEEYLSGTLEINGTKHSFVAFKNKYRKDGDSRSPYYKIFLKNKHEDGQDSPF